MRFQEPQKVLFVSPPFSRRADKVPFFLVVVVLLGLKQSHSSFLPQEIEDKVHFLIVVKAVEFEAFHVEFEIGHVGRNVFRVEKGVIEAKDGHAGNLVDRPGFVGKDCLELDTGGAVGLKGLVGYLVAGYLVRQGPNVLGTRID